MIGRHLGHYLVLAKLGSGGMGDVYVAQDTRLDRQVALKLPRREASESTDRLTNLQREARAAAALNHPNIVHLYSVEEADGQLFITMELVQGRSLRMVLSDGAPLALPRTIAFARQIAEGLACAHAAGVVHCDLKPANVMIAGEDRVKILDFGVARVLRTVASWNADLATTTATELSSRGMAVGTLGYMSPEQALGKPLDARTDLFALGVILFEMATGRAPFEGSTPAAIFDQLLNRRDSALALNPELPSSLATVIDKALEKNPEQRYWSAHDFLEDLRRIDPLQALPGAVGPALPPAPVAPVTVDGARPASIVVLPFVDLSAERDQEYFCHGITEEIISALTRIPELRVISRTSAFAFHGKGMEVTEIGRRLRVGTALEGSVRKAGGRVRVTAQLVNAGDGYQLWSKRFDRELSDVFAIQDEIAAAIVGEFEMSRGGHVPAPRAPLDVLAHDAYLKGMYERNKWTADSMQRAIANFRQAIAHDSAFAPAYVALAESHVWLYSGLSILSPREAVPLARRAIETALQLDATLADAHRIRGLIAMSHDWDRRAAEDALMRALQLAPGSAAAHFWNAWRLALLERQYEQAFIELDEAERLDPLDLQLKTQIGYVHHFHHDTGRAIAQFEKVLALEPSFAFAHYALGDAYLQRGDFDRALAAYGRSIELSGRSANHVGVLGYAYGRSGNRDLANEHLQELGSRAKDGYVSPMWFALVHLGLGDVDALFEWLDRAVDARDGSLILITAAVEFDPVRDDPRFKSLLEKMGLGG